ncbi:MAG: sulfurtransferase TusA family protein [Planctomycetota bacterium]
MPAPVEPFRAAPSPGDDGTDDRPIRAATVIAEADARWGARCGGCTTALIGHDVVLSMLMGLRDAPRCAACLAASVGDELRPFLTRAHANVRRLDCFAAGWRHSDRRLAAEHASWPEERMPAALRLALDEVEPDEEGAVGHLPPTERAPAPAPTRSVPAHLTPAPPEVAASFDAGDMGCGDLVLELRSKLMALAPGAVLEVRATDPGAPGDLPAWCRVTRHALVHSEHPRYWIRRRDDA